MSEFQDKIRSIGFARQRGASERRPILDERDGRVGGYEVEHWNDSQDAVVRPRPVRASVKLLNGEE